MSSACSSSTFRRGSGGRGVGREEARIAATGPRIRGKRKNTAKFGKNGGPEIDEGINVTDTYSCWLLP